MTGYTSGTAIKMSNLTTKKVFATYSGTSHFEIPSDVKEYSIIWDKLTYKDKEGVEHEVEPSVDASEDVELFKRPSDHWSENDESDKDFPPDWFYDWFHSDKRNVVEILWERLKHQERQELFEEMQEEEKDEQESDDETSEK